MLKPKCHDKRLSVKNLLSKYQDWYMPKFHEEAPLSFEIFLRGFGHVQYAKAVATLYAIFKYNYHDMIDYADFVFKSWSATTGNGASIKYFPNWLVSVAMISQYKDSIKTSKIKKTVEEHRTYSVHKTEMSKDTVFYFSPTGALNAAKAKST
jgi:hypothetical protein